MFSIAAYAARLFGKASPRTLQRNAGTSTVSFPRNPSPAKTHDSILSTVGSTPVIKLNRLVEEDGPYKLPRGVTVYVKCEAFNPMGSVKDRLAMGIIEWAEAHGQLKPGQTVIEATSGNTGIGLAMVCAAKGYPFVCVMAESFSIERRKLMRFLGAKVVLTNPAHKGAGMLIKCNELAKEHGYFNARQFTSEANAWIHAQTTGPEIVDAMKQVPAGLSGGLDHFFCSWGTGGTLNGVGQVLREKSPKTKIHVCEPDNAPLLYSEVKSEFDGDGLLKEPHPLWRPHLLQGWAPDFVSPILQDAVDSGFIDKVHHTPSGEAQDCARELAQKEGIFTGTSGGGSLANALKYAKSLPEGSTVLAILPDTGERYLSTPLFADIPADMTAEEKELAKSTPSAAPPGITLPPVTPEATKFVLEAIKKDPVVIFSLEYCEFCWTIFGLFDAIGVPYVAINIDSFQYAKNNTGNKYRAALQKHTECITFPQCFIGGEFLGGAVDACLKWKKGELQPLLQAAGVDGGGDFRGYSGDPFEFLPKWMTQNPLRSK